jgi:hypothetical protein
MLSDAGTAEPRSLLDEKRATEKIRFSFHCSRLPYPYNCSRITITSWLFRGLGIGCGDRDFNRRHCRRRGGHGRIRKDLSVTNPTRKLLSGRRRISGHCDHCARRRSRKGTRQALPGSPRQPWQKCVKGLLCLPSLRHEAHGAASIEMPLVPEKPRRIQENQLSKAMIPIPSPLHPTIVHFPIVLILLGAVAAVVAVFIRRWHLPWLAAGLLADGRISRTRQRQPSDKTRQHTANLRQVLESRDRESSDRFATQRRRCVVERTL